MRGPASVAVTVLLVRLVDEWASFLPAATFDAFRLDLGLTYRGAALALLAIGPGAIVGSAVTVLGDRRSRRVLATAGGATYTVALALFAAAMNPWMLIAGGVGVGLGATLLVDTIEVALVDLCEASDAAESGDALEHVLARMNVAAGVGDLAGPIVVAGTAALGWSWRVALAATALAVAAYTVLVSITPLPRPTPSARAAHKEAHVLSLLRRADVWRAGACGAVLVALDESFIAYVIAFLREDAGTSAAVATAISAFFVVGGLVAAARIARHTGVTARRARTTATRLRMAAAAMVPATLALAIWPTPFVIALSGLAVGAATIAFWVPFQAATLRLVPGRTAAVSAIVGTIEMAGLGVAPLIGVVSDAYGLRVALGAYAVLPAALLMLVINGGFPPGKDGNAFADSGELPVGTDSGCA